MKIDEEIKEINSKLIKLKKRKTELLERKEKLKQISYQKQTDSKSDENKWAHTGIFILHNLKAYIFTKALHTHIKL